METLGGQEMWMQYWEKNVYGMVIMINIELSTYWSKYTSCINFLPSEEIIIIFPWFSSALNIKFIF